ncbi:bifunctional 6-phosphofructo-2-kinase/fructose-2,6-bisphosphate 2-phosphatase [Trichodelitschia bisporula]|uniref:Bifunctional 6-phosphofructo-2-kinase/fructose-2,6-bisphosphate 2-phosphatase n=1 Tax=Trichodelitschia bisporula TaxID=703511 RepID=A0A6G1HME2_9PEZI|nr:bifunctional 6-phosphofructo-2-kinase/fructose-2,6-bisphosphate 2-phosphatase [Trichodelitschia bisporula]
MQKKPHSIDTVPKVETRLRHQVRDDDDDEDPPPGGSVDGAVQPPELKPNTRSDLRHLPKSLPPRPTTKEGAAIGAALSDTPASSNPGSPSIPAMKPQSYASTPRVRPTTLDIPGLTRSRVSPDGRISQRDIGSKLVIVMVGLPARGKSYITKKLARYMNWLQHDTKIFNVGEKRRLVAHAMDGDHTHPVQLEGAQLAAQILMSDEAGGPSTPIIPSFSLNDAALPVPGESPATSPNEVTGGKTEGHTPVTEQTAEFFDPNNAEAARIREQCAIDTLDELLQYILVEGGSVGILDATNSTLSRRKLVMERIREKAGDHLNVLFIESICEDETLLESNMRLKLSGPDYKDKDPVASLTDFRKRVAIYQKNYVPLGDYEEKNNMPYVKVIDVGRKVNCHQIKGFLSSTAVSYLLNFNLAPRQIWITRHGESLDNVAGKIGGDSALSEKGVGYAVHLAKFVEAQRKEWDIRQRDRAAHTHFPPHPGDHTPPNPVFSAGPEGEIPDMNFCVWTSMLKRGVDTAQFFDEEEFDIKQMRMLDELNAGIMEGMTYEEIKTKYEADYKLRRQDKLAYRYPGPGGEGYLDVINRLRPVIVELERMTDHCLLITHRSVARVLLAYFMGLRRDEVADLDCPLGMLYSLEPKPYGVEFKAHRYNEKTGWFYHLPDFQLRPSAEGHL